MAKTKLEKRDEEFADKRVKSALEVYKEKMNHLASYEYLSDVINNDKENPLSRVKAAISLLPYQIAKQPTTVDVNQKVSETVNHVHHIEGLKELVKLQKKPKEINEVGTVIDQVIENEVPDE